MNQSAAVFGNPSELNDAWLSNHQDHSLCWLTHTVFQKKKGGQKFKECICYTCRKTARELLNKVSTIRLPAEKKPKRKKRMTKIPF